MIFYVVHPWIFFVDFVEFLFDVLVANITVLLFPAELEEWTNDILLSVLIREACDRLHVSLYFFAFFSFFFQFSLSVNKSRYAFMILHNFFLFFIVCVSKIWRFFFNKTICYIFLSIDGCFFLIFWVGLPGKSSSARLCKCVVYL